MHFEPFATTGILSRILEGISHSAKQEYQEKVLSHIRESASFKRYVDMIKMMLNRNSDLSDCLHIAAEDTRDEFSLAFVRKFLTDNKFIDEKYDTRSTISDDGIKAYIDYHWHAVDGQQREKHKSAKLIGKHGKKMVNLLRRLLSLIADWYFYASASAVHTSGTEYSRDKKKIHALVKEALTACQNVPESAALPVQAGNAALCSVLEELDARLGGTYIEKGNRWFYVPFLQYGEVMLGEDFIPELSPELARIEGFSVMEVAPT